MCMVNVDALVKVAMVMNFFLQLIIQSPFCRFICIIILYNGGKVNKCWIMDRRGGWSGGEGMDRRKWGGDV